MKKDNKILLHSCCAICSAYPISHLRELGYEPVVYFFNPNIFPECEFNKRLGAQKELCKNLNCELIIESYEPKYHEIISFGLEDEPEKGKRCAKCFEMRLTQSAKKAKELGIKSFTTTIVISPHKSFELISKLGKTISNKYGINYLDIDFKKNDGFLKSNQKAKELGLYRQNYCGCKYSMGAKNGV
ncbi:MAG TPA: epoxyqueuosine reductase QueH [Candidatus Gastranaerophilaceae bacterium]|nr:epoxyqueuosine reductase QueH [Candidatus Gastranaerophilaceae bacterium]